MERRNIAIIGTGGMAREVRWVIEDINKSDARWNILGWVSKDESGSIVAGLPVLGDDEWLLAHESPIDVAVSVGDGSLRKRIVSVLKKNKNISFPVISARSAEISDYVNLGEGSIIMNQSLLTVDISAGDFFLCNYGCTIGHDCVFDDYVTINPGVRISGAVHIGECSTIGVGASVIQNVKIGSKTIIGAGAVVINDIENNCTAVGVPAKPLEKKHE